MKHVEGHFDVEFLVNMCCKMLVNCGSRLSGSIQLSITKIQGEMLEMLMEYISVGDIEQREIEIEIERKR